jgi:hypothetical protein
MLRSAALIRMFFAAFRGLAGIRKRIEMFDFIH